MFGNAMQRPRQSRVGENDIDHGSNRYEPADQRQLVAGCAPTEIDIQTIGPAVKSYVVTGSQNGSGTLYTRLTFLPGR